MLAKLVLLPDGVVEPVLAQLCRSIDRLVERAYDDICADRINVFD